MIICVDYLCLCQLVIDLLDEDNQNVLILILVVDIKVYQEVEVEVNGCWIMIDLKVICW